MSSVTVHDEDSRTDSDTAQCGSSTEETKTTSTAEELHGGQHVPRRNSSPKQLSDTTQLSAVNICEEEIRKLYKNEDSFVQLNPFIDNANVYHGDIFTKLRLATGDMEFVSFDDIFHLKTEDGDLIKRAILNGSAGKGKTTLFGKVIYDWAHEKSMQKFKLVFALKMSALDQSSNLLDAIFDQILGEDTCVDRRNLELFIQHNPSEVLILLDGFDELTTDPLCQAKFGSVLKILNREMLEECWAVVTTRPTHFDRLVTDSLIQQPYSHVTVQGFDEETMTGYVNKCYSEEHEKAGGLLQRIKSSDFLSDLAMNPMVLTLLCSLWSVGSALPETLWGIYTDALMYMFKSKCDLAMDEISIILIEIGKIGLGCLLSQDQMLSFKETEFDKGILAKAIQSGILTRPRVFKGQHPRNSIQFIHKTMQDFCGAKYFQYLLRTDSGEYQRTLDTFSHSLSNNCDDLEYLLRFCCGENKACVNDILRMFLRSPGYEQDRLVRTSLNCYYEGQSKIFPPEEIVHLILKPEVSILHHKISPVSFTYFVKCLAEDPSDRGKAVIGQVHAARVYVSNSEDMLHVCEALGYMDNLVRLNLSDSFQLSGSTASWIHRLAPFKQLRKLDASSCMWTGDDMSRIVAMLSLNMSNLVELNLSNNTSRLAGSALSWGHYLAQLKELQKLDLGTCWLTREDMNHIGEALSCMINLVDLNLSFSHCSGVPWNRYFQNLKHLRKLEMASSELIGDDMNCIGEALSYMDNLIELNVCFNTNLGGSAIPWGHRLKPLKTLQKLNLMHCRLLVEDMNHIGEALCSMDSLDELRLNRNGFLGGSTLSWGHHFKQLKQVLKLDMRRCNLNAEDIELIEAGSVILMH